MTFHEWVEKVASFLDDWRYQATGVDRASLVHRTMDAEVTMTLHLYGEAATRNLEGGGIKTTVWPVLIKEDGNDFHPYDSPLRSGVGITIGRDPKAAAGDIKRRLLDPYLVEFEEAMRKRQDYIDRRDAARDMTSRLAEIVGGKTGNLEQLKFYKRQPRGNYLSPTITGEVTQGYEDRLSTVKLVLDCLTYEQAAAVVQAAKAAME